MREGVYQVKRRVFGGRVGKLWWRGSSVCNLDPTEQIGKPYSIRKGIVSCFVSY